MTEFDFADAVKKRRLLPFSDGPKVMDKELDSAKDDLESAKSSFQSGNFKWATIQAYYSIFHLCRVLLYKMKYREKSHTWLMRAIKHFYIESEMLPEEFYRNAVQSMELREMADYKGTFSREGAERTIESAEEAFRQIMALIK